MPRNGSGVASPPANTSAGPPNTTIASAKQNSVIADIYQLFNTPAPFAAGGTNASTKEGARVSLEVDKQVIYSEKSANYGAVAADNNVTFRFTAAATLSLDPAATLGTNWHAVVIADGGDVTIDPNSSETIDGATTLVIPNGSAARIICSGSAFYTEKTNVPLQPFATVASAATTDIGAVTSKNVTVTGTTTITSLGTAPAGTFRRLVFSGSLTLTYNVTSLILPGAKNITTLAGDSAELVSLGSGNWRCTSYQLAGNPTWRTLYNRDFTTQSNIDVVTGVGFSRMIRITGSVTVSTATGFGIRFSTDDGATYKSGATDYIRNLLYFTNGTSVAQSGTDNAIYLNAGENINPAHSFTFSILVDNINAGTLATIDSSGSYRGSTSGNLFKASVSGQMVVANSPIGGIRFLPIAGTISGRITVEGLL